MKRLLLGAGLAATLMGSAAMPTFASRGEECSYQYNPIAGNYVVTTYNWGQNRDGGEPQQYTTNRPPKSCFYAGTITP